MDFTPENQNTFESVANVTLVTEDSPKSISTITKSVITPKEYLTEEFIEVRSESLIQIYEILNETQKSKWPAGEILLGISTCCIGGTISALCSSIELDTNLGITMYILLPVIAVGTFVSYFFTRHNQLTDIHNVSKQIKKLLPIKEATQNEH